jgi:hypothetical protein
VRGYAGGKTCWPGGSLIAVVACRGRGSANPRFGAFLEREMSARIEGCEAYFGIYIYIKIIVMFFY